MMEEIRRKDEEAQKAADDGYYSYGDISSIDDILGLNQAPAETQSNILQSALMAEDKSLPAYRKGGSVMKSALMAATGGSIEDHRHPEYDGTTPVFKTGGKSNHVQGPGDGQSDDIPAMLADGEFVFEGAPIALRGTFLIDKEGIVRHCEINDFPLGRNIENTLRTLDALVYVETHGEVCPANWEAGKDAMSATRDGVASYLASH
jgi:hypothetical protein